METENKKYRDTLIIFGVEIPAYIEFSVNHKTWSEGRGEHFGTPCSEEMGESYISGEPEGWICDDIEIHIIKYFKKNFPVLSEKHKEKLTDDLYSLIEDFLSVYPIPSHEELLESIRE